MEQTKISQALASAGITMLDLVDILINMGVFQGRHESAVMGAEEFAEKYHMAPQTVRVYCKMAGSPAWTAGEGSPGGMVDAGGRNAGLYQTANGEEKRMSGEDPRQVLPHKHKRMQMATQ